MLERADRHDSVHRLVKALPALEQHPLGTRAIRRREQLLDVGNLVLGQRQADHVDVVFLDGSQHGGAPAAAEVQQRHAWLQAQLAQREVDLGDLRLFQCHVLAAKEVGARIHLRAVEEQAEEVVR